MHIQEIIEWLKTSIIGIILLGAAGSLLAMLILRVVRRLLVVCLKRFQSFLESHLAAYATNKLLAQMYADVPDKSHLIILCVYKITSFIASFVALSFSLAVTGIYFLLAGVTFSLPALLLTTLCMCCLSMWFRCAAAAAAIHSVVLKRDEDRFQNLVQKPGDAITAFKVAEEREEDKKEPNRVRGGD